MFFRLIASWLTFLFCLFAGFTWVAGDSAAEVEGRLTVADVIGGSLILVVLVRGVIGDRGRFRLPIELRAYLPLLLVFAIGVAFSKLPQKGLLELTIHAFIYAVAIALVIAQGRVPTEQSVSRLLMMILVAGAILAGLGLVDFLVWPSLLPGVSDGLAGTFRNTGQAGAFFGVYLALLVPAFLSGLIRPSRVNVLLLVVIAIALMFTVKRAAILGALIGFLLLAISMALSKSVRDKRYGAMALVVLLLVVPALAALFSWGVENIEGLSWRVTKKINANTATDFSEGFLADNIAAASAAFQQDPIVGVGLGNVGGIITDKYEIHSTYLAIIGNSGLLGVIGYLIFMGVLLISVWKGRGPSPCERYLRYFLPMLIGLMVAWSYTYHLRKREFWILVATIVVIRTVVRYTRRAVIAPAGNVR